MTHSSFGTPLTSGSIRVLLLGSGELGKELAIAFQRLGIEVIACDRYDNAPAMQVAHRSHVLDMLDPSALRDVVAAERPHVILPELEAIATDVLADFENAGIRVAPTAEAARITMNREHIRRLVAEDLALPTSPYRFVESADQLRTAAEELGFPCVVKPLMSSSGKGQSVVRDAAECEAAWLHAAHDGRAAGTRVIVEGFVDFDYEVTLLTARHIAGTTFLEPIGHTQVDGDFRESWQPQPMSQAAALEARRIATAVTDALGGWGVFGVELFVRGDEVIFSEVSPRPHDTGMVTLVSHPASEFVVHARAVLGLPVHHVAAEPSAAAALVAEGSGVPTFYGIPDALSRPDTELRLFGKPRVDGRRRVGVTLARGATVEEARARALEAAACIEISLD